MREILFRQRWKRLAVMLAVLALAATGCRSGSDEDTAAPVESDVVTEAPEEEPTEAAESESESEPAAAGDVTFDRGVTEEPCPAATNEDNGCIYLGTISDLTQGPFAALGPSIVAGQAAFWQRVNDEGGIGGFDVDVSEFVRDNLYSPETHAQVYSEIRGDVLALAQTLGSPTTAAILDDLEADDMAAAPASWTSGNDFEQVILESGNNYCVESMNSVDWWTEDQGNEVTTVAAVHYPGDYGDDAAFGTRSAAEARGLEFLDIPQTPAAAGGTTQAAVSQLVAEAPELVIITTGPAEAAEIIGTAAAQGFTGQFIGTSPTWNPGLLQTPALPALQAQYIQSSPWASYEADDAAHEALREYTSDLTPNDGLTSGWMWSYPLRAALEAAAENGDLTPAGVIAAVESLEAVDYEGALPEEAGNFSGSPDEQAFRGTFFSEVTEESPTGVAALIDEPYSGPSAEEFTFDQPCFQSYAG